MAEKRQRKKKLIPLGEHLDTVYAAKEWTTQWRLFSLARNWPRIVGERVAALTAPAWFRRDVLWVYVQDSSWMHHLQYVKIDLLGRINEHLKGAGAQGVTDIRWTLEPEKIPEPEEKIPQAHPVDPDEERSFCLMTEVVANEDCRQALQRLWHNFASYSEDASEKKGKKEQDSFE